MQAEMSILDEVDSGLDIDALREVATAVNGLRNEKTATLMVTHYQVHLGSHESLNLVSWPPTQLMPLAV